MWRVALTADSEEEVMRSWVYWANVVKFDWLMINFLRDQSGGPLSNQLKSEFRIHGPKQTTQIVGTWCLPEGELNSLHKHRGNHGNIHITIQKQSINHRHNDLLHFAAMGVLPTNMLNANRHIHPHLYAQRRSFKNTHTKAHKTHIFVSSTEHHPAVIQSDEILKKKGMETKPASNQPATSKIQAHWLSLAALQWLHVIEPLQPYLAHFTQFILPYHYYL